jgi:hypothetical protein
VIASTKATLALQEKKEDILAISRIQASFRGWPERRNFNRNLRSKRTKRKNTSTCAAPRIQSIVRGFLQCRKLDSVHFGGRRKEATTSVPPRTIYKEEQEKCAGYSFLGRVFSQKGRQSPAKLSKTNKIKGSRITMLCPRIKIKWR